MVLGARAFWVQAQLLLCEVLTPKHTLKFVMFGDMATCIGDSQQAAFPNRGSVAFSKTAQQMTRLAGSRLAAIRPDAVQLVSK